MQITHELMLALGFRVDGVNKGCYIMNIANSSRNIYINLQNPYTVKDVVDIIIERVRNVAYDMGQKDKEYTIRSVLGINED